MTTFRLELMPLDRIDLALAASEPFTLWRRDGVVYLGTAGDGARLRGALAKCSVSAVPVEVLSPAPPPGTLRAIGTRLDPVPLAAAELDILEVRPVALGVAPVPPLPDGFLAGSPAAPDEAEAHGTDLALYVSRSVWCSGATLRAARRTLRPALFDRAGPARQLRAFAADGMLWRWIAG